MSKDESFLVLGGGGMIGLQIVWQVARHLSPRHIVIVSLYEDEVREALAECEREFPGVKFTGFWGDVFLRADWNAARQTRTQLMESPDRRAELFADLFDDLEAAYARSQLAKLILEHRPNVVVDSINTATAISYQDVYTASAIAKREMDALAARIAAGDAAGIAKTSVSADRAVEALLIAQSVPQLIRHVTLIHRAMTEAGTRLYLKVGTTGTGGMGLNIPYTHSEDKPSAQLMTKTAVAFAHTGLMFLMARTPGGPAVKEVKPAAMVGYADIGPRAVRERGAPVYLFTSRAETLGASLALREPETNYQRLQELQMVVVDTGENGMFTRGEFETITHGGQMEFITPEEIAQQVLLEIRGSNTGYDVIAAIDGAVMNPTFRAGYLRQFALDEAARLEKETGLLHSVAIGQLGPPEIGKLLWEAHLLKLRYGTLGGVIRQPADTLAAEVYALVQSDANLRQTITSVGLPILAPDGKSLLRGPFIRIPEAPATSTVPLTTEHIDQWAAKGWVDLRPQNFEAWRARFQRMQAEAQPTRGRGSAAFNRETYRFEEISIGAVVGWIFNNEAGGYRIK